MVKAGKIEGLAQIRHRHNGKFQPFALMDAHQPHRVRRRGRGRFHIHFALLLGLDKFQKTVKALAVVSVELARQLQQALDVGPLLFTAFLGGNPVAVMSLVDDAFQAMRDGGLPRQLAPFRKMPKKCVRLFISGIANLRRFVPLVQRVPKTSVLAPDANGCQFPVRQPNQRRPQNAQQRQVLQRIVQHLQQAEQVAHFEALVKSAARSQQRNPHPANSLT